MTDVKTVALGAIVALVLLVVASVGASAHEIGVLSSAVDPALVTRSPLTEIPVRPLFAVLGVISLIAGAAVLRRAPKLEC